LRDPPAAAASAPIPQPEMIVAKRANKFWSAGRNRPKTSFTEATFSGPAEQGHPDCDLFARYSIASLIADM
jgi:hypothetical protein